MGFDNNGSAIERLYTHDAQTEIRFSGIFQPIWGNYFVKQWKRL
jgi:hypothetical protein